MQADFEDLTTRLYEIEAYLTAQEKGYKINLLTVTKVCPSYICTMENGSVPITALFDKDH